MWRDDAHRDNVFERFVDTHFELDDILCWEHQEETGCRIRCCRNVHADVCTREVIDNVTTRLPCLKSNCPTTLVGVLNKQCLAKGVAVRRKKRVGNLLDAVVDGIDDGALIFFPTKRQVFGQ